MKYFRVSETAKMLDVSRQTIYNKIKELGIEVTVKDSVKQLTSEQVESIRLSIEALHVDNDFTDKTASKMPSKQLNSDTDTTLYLEQIDLLKKQIEGLEQDKKDLKQQVKDKEYQFAYLLSINQEQQKAPNSLENNNYSKQDISLWEKIKNKLTGST